MELENIYQIDYEEIDIAYSIAIHPLSRDIMKHLQLWIGLYLLLL